MSASILTSLGLESLIATSTLDYIRIASQLAADKERLMELRQSMRERMQRSPLLDAKGFVKRLEGALRTMWRDAYQKNTSADFAVMNEQGESSVTT